MSKRGKQCLLHIVLIVLVIVATFQYHDVYLTPEALMEPNEYGMHYGPSKQVLLAYEYNDGENCLMIGKVDDHLLSLIDTQRTWKFFWHLGSFIIGPFGFSEDEAADALLHGSGLLLGLTDLAQADHVLVMATWGAWEESFYADVDTDGFFYVETELENPQDWMAEETAIFDKEGRLIYKKYLGDDGVFHSEYYD